MSHTKVKRFRRGTNYWKKQFGGFMGFNAMWDVFDRTDSNITKVIMMGLFKTGCRACELGTIRKKQFNFDYSPTQIMVTSVMVEKQKETVYLTDENGNPIYVNGKRKYTFESIEDTRTFPIKKSEPFSDDLEYYVKTFVKNDEDIVFPWKYNNIYYRLAMVDNTIPSGGNRDKWWKYKGPFWAHRLRSERASQLIRDNHYTILDLMSFFGWKSSKMPEVYSGITPIDLIREEEVNYR